VSRFVKHGGTRAGVAALGLLWFVACDPSAPPAAPATSPVADAGARRSACDDPFVLWVPSEAGAPCPPPSIEFADDPLQGGPRDNLIHGK